MPNSNLNVIIKSILQATDSDVKKQIIEIQKMVSTQKPIKMQIEIDGEKLNQIQSQLESATKDTTSGVKTSTTRDGAAFISTKIIQEFKKALHEIIHMDTQLTELSKVLNITKFQFQQLGMEALGFAGKYGLVVGDVLNLQTGFAKAGFSNYQQMGEVAIIAKSAGDLTSELVTDYLLASNAAFEYGGNIDKLMSLLDQQNQLSNKTATTMTDLTEGTKKFANAAASAGESEQSMSAMLSTIIAKGRLTGEEAGKTLNNVTLRLKQVQQAFEGFDYKVDGEVVDAAEMSSAAKSLKSVGIEILKMKDGVEKVRPLSEIIVDIDGALQDGRLSAIDFNKIIDAFAGKNHSEGFTALVSNIDTFHEHLTHMEGAQGSALGETEKSAASFQGRLNALQNEWTAFFASFTNLQGLGTTVLNGVIKMVEALRTLSPLMNSIPGQITLILVGFNAISKTKAFDSIKNTFLGLGGLKIFNRVPFRRLPEVS